MNTIFLFNPENDLALACNRSNYSPPRNALALRESGATLPLWYSEETDMVLVEREIDRRWIDNLRSLFGIKAEVITTAAETRVDGCRPWGWSPAARIQFLRAGVNGDILPDDSTIQRLRDASHRRMTVDILKNLQKKSLFPGMIPVELRDAELLPSLLTGMDSEGLFLKSPWSSTGRGVIPSKGKEITDVMSQAKGIIRRQGSVMVEKGYRKIRDFAMLFRKGKGGEVKYAGLSLFDTTSQAYSGNILATEEKLLQILSLDVASEDVDRVREGLVGALDMHIPDVYDGYFGVDMMIVESADGSRWIHPCVEINLRMTMGVVAHLLSEKYLSPGSAGRFMVSFGSRRKDGNLLVDECRLVEGDLSLVPADGVFSMTVSVERTRI